MKLTIETEDQCVAANKMEKIEIDRSADGERRRRGAESVVWD